MNCLIFTGGGFPEKTRAERYLPEHSFCIAADSGLVAADSYGVVPDVMIGDMDSVPCELREKYPFLHVETWPQDKDFSDTELALKRAEKHLSSFIVLLGGSGGRLDHLFAIRNIFAQSVHPDVWLTEQNAVFCIDSSQEGKNTLYAEGLSLCDAVSVFPVFNMAQGEYGAGSCVSRGLQWPLDPLVWKDGFSSLSNRIIPQYEGKKISISAIYGRYLIILPLEQVIYAGYEKSTQDLQY